MQPVHETARLRNQLTLAVYWTKGIPSEQSCRVLKQAAELFIDQLVREDVQRGHFRLMQQRQRQLRTEDKFRVAMCSNHTIKLTIKPGNNSTAHEYELIVPNTIEAEHLYQRLRRHQSVEEPTEEPEEDAEVNAQEQLLKEAVVLTDAVKTLDTFLPDAVRKELDDPTQPLFEVATDGQRAGLVATSTNALTGALAAFREIIEAAGRVSDRDAAKQSLTQKRRTLAEQLETFDEQLRIFTEQLDKKRNVVREQLKALDDEILSLDVSEEEDAQSREAMQLMQTLQQFMPRS